MSETASCIFCRIIRQEIPAEVVHASERAVAFLDIEPLADGHVVVIPRTHVARVRDLAAADAEGLFRAVAELAGPVQRATAAEGTTIGINDGEVTGQTVPHVHVHIVPRRRGDGAGSIHSMFSRGQRQPVATMAGTIRKEISR
jgi:histidine triad (HIT) family protein